MKDLIQSIALAAGTFSMGYTACCSHFLPIKIAAVIGVIAIEWQYIDLTRLENKLKEKEKQEEASENTEQQ